MIAAFLIILACQLAGEVFSRTTGLPIPGPVLGMALMLLGLRLSPWLRQTVRPVAEGILRNLLLLFVPAGVGAAGHLVTLGANTLPVVLAVAGSTVLAIIAGALAFKAVAALSGLRPEEGP
ncbi:CidA/LrgA family protein [Xinfangfangia pollutisoli]|uniref:CidA/LrgA family protein n=1 Tax=Xinfangfangia pollutisoli TaxID=2865960 RepID=UPI001CD34992|nr:CidA/LrgA family protein [Xinfangfangia pollutisoli]